MAAWVAKAVLRCSGKGYAETCEAHNPPKRQPLVTSEFMRVPGKRPGSRTAISQQGGPGPREQFSEGSTARNTAYPGPAFLLLLFLPTPDSAAIWSLFLKKIKNKKTENKKKKRNCLSPCVLTAVHFCVCLSQTSLGADRPQTLPPFSQFPVDPTAHWSLACPSPWSLFKSLTTSQSLHSKASFSHSPFASLP